MSLKISTPTQSAAIPESIAQILVKEVTKDIAVTVETSFLEAESDPSGNHYVYSYTVTIENFGPSSVQLMTRHWIVNSGGAEYVRVNGEGVVGEQPQLEPEHGFRYTSGTSIKDPVGTMSGHYTFKRVKDGELFDVQIPRFDLIYPHLLH